MVSAASRAISGGTVRVPDRPGLGVTLDRDALAKLHQQYLDCGIVRRDDAAQMRRYAPSFTGALPRFTEEVKA